MFPIVFYFQSTKKVNTNVDHDCDVFRTLFGQFRESSRRIDEEFFFDARFGSAGAGKEGAGFDCAKPG